MFLLVSFTAIGKQMRSEGISKQAGAVFQFRATGSLFARLVFVAMSVGVDLHFGIIDFGYGVEPILTHRFKFVAELTVTLDA
ncbi:hypothetical protein D3C72_1362580 [compost metagenome]